MLQDVRPAVWSAWRAKPRRMATKKKRQAVRKSARRSGPHEFDVTLVVVMDHPPTNSLRIYNRKVRLPFVPQIKMTIVLETLDPKIGAETFEIGEVSYSLANGRFSAVMQTDGYRDATEDEIPWPKLGFREQMPRYQHRK
jgi:hypothetical protein